MFSTLINKKINFAEIGIWENESIKMWREYFKKAKIYGFEYYDNLIQNAKKDKLKKVFIKKINVKDKKNILISFKETNTKFDIIVDDSTHLFDHQINIIYNSHNYLKENGILIIEDIYKYKSGYEEKKYYEKIAPIKKEFENIFFIETPHVNNFTASWKNEKLLVLIKNKK